MNVAKIAPVGSASAQGDLWGVRARDYAEVQEQTFLPLYESVLARPEIAKASSILDVGCGPGLAAQVFSGRIGRVAGADATAPFIEIARRRAPGGVFRVAEMESLPYEDGAFDAVTGFNAFQYAASPVNALREARRVAKAGGIIVIAVWGAPETCEAAGHLKALGSLMPPRRPARLVHLRFRAKPSSRCWRAKPV
jgi:SAM-dependent methyltransferase